MKKGGFTMRLTIKKSVLPFLFFFLGSMMMIGGCATTEQIQSLEQKVNQALSSADKAQADAEFARGEVTRCCEESAKNTQIVKDAAARADEAASRAEDAATKAEDAASKAQASARSAEQSATKAESMAGKTQDLYDRIMAK